MLALDSCSLSSPNSPDRPHKWYTLIYGLVSTGMSHQVQQAKRRMRQTQANPSTWKKCNLFKSYGREKVNLDSSTDNKDEATVFNWCIFTKLLAGINLIQTKEKQIKSHWSLRWSLHCITVYWGLSATSPYYEIKTHFLWNKHYESMFGYEAKGRSTHAITRYWSGFVSHLFWELKRPLGTFINHPWTQQGCLQ